jgi:dihydroneopterin aldolase
MDKIILKNMAFFGYHGVLDEEKALGQKFYVDLELFLDLKKAGMTDNLEETVSYAEVYQLVKELITETRFNLIEALAENIAAQILLNFEKIQEVTVIIRKPEAPVPGIFDYFSIEIRRKRNG